MKIYLFLNNKLLQFLLPKDALGSFSFDEYENEESKLINVEGKDNKWYIYSTSEVKIYENDSLVKKTLLESGKFYFLKRNNINYLIYCYDATKCNVNIYRHNKNFNLIIGSGNNCNLRFKHSFKAEISARIYFEKEKCFLDKKVPYIYADNILINSDSYEIKYGTEINIYYLKIIVLSDLVLIFSDEKVAFQNMLITNLKEYSLAQDKPIEIEIKDENLYSKNDYYYKSPRLRRFIKTKEIRFSKPPVGNPDEELPAILTIGPIFTMGVLSFVNLTSTLSNIFSGEATLSTEWPRLLTSTAMLLSMIMWPLIIKWYSKRLKKRKRKKLEEKYGAYLLDRRTELTAEAHYQSTVLHENLLSTTECLNVILKQGYNFWDRRRDQDDFLQVRLGLGYDKLDVDIKYSEEDFTVDEDNLKKQASKVVEDFKYIYNVPLRYSFYDNKITAIIGYPYKCHSFMNNLILQLITFYTYEDLKFVVFTNKQNENNWQYLKYLNHSFSNSRNFRFFSSNIEDAKNISEYLIHIANQRLQNVQKNSAKSNVPYFIVIIDDYDMIKSLEFIKLITETEVDIGFSIVLLQDRLSELPSRCNNFISIAMNSKCEVIRNTADDQEFSEFTEEIVYNLDMMNIARKVSNIPIEFENGIDVLPDSISFLGMEKVGKIEQLNILNRWKTNDSTISLKSEIGVDQSGNLIYLDLHEKAHGPHGLIAGTTGSGKSEFIITYILSLCINYSPDIVSFVLIDYKGGGLALAFENKSLGIVLPHLAGTITNLDKAEMDRTLVSIDSEVKRRQRLFNEARENLGESTIDIYKYQRYYKEGKLKEPIPHLFIICDEFAELKSQQTEFMDNLISVARIGRSLGVHLILATQKPSGVVNEQIWSNSKFKVCLKVQDENDSKEIIRKPDAAYLKQAGRFYLQVGYDELYVLGQSGWCGAKYFPSDKIVKEVDKSLNFINDSGKFIKSIKASNNKKSVAQGEQFNAILNSIIEISNKIGKKSKKLWLDNIEPIILVDDLKNKYNIKTTAYNVEAIIGEYDAPEIQHQDIVKYNYLNDGNTIIYGNDGAENEMLLETIIYSTCKYHSSSEVNFYILDYGSESLRKYESLSHVGGIVYATDEEKYNNLIKLIRKEIKYRKKLFANYGGDYKNYIKTNKLPLLVVMLNNYDSITDTNKNFFEIIPDLIRDSERYGIVFIITCNTINSINNKISSNCPNVYTFKLKDQSDYMSVFGIKVANTLREITGRGFVKNDKVHEFQTASIIGDDNFDSDFIINFIKHVNSLNLTKAPSIPVLPEQVKYDNISEKVSDLNNVPIGISKEDLSILTIDYLNDIGNIISSNRLNNIDRFIKSLIMTFKSIKNLEIFVIDPLYKLKLDRNYVNNYFVEDMDSLVDNFNKYLDKLNKENYNVNGVIIIYGIDKFISKLKNTQDFQSMLQKLKAYEQISIIIADDAMKIRNYLFESWFKLLFNINNGIWVGKGIADQNLFHLTTITKEMTKEIENNMGYIISESTPTLCKILDFLEKEEGN